MMEHHVISVIQNIQTIHIVLTIVWKGGYQFTNKKNNKTRIVYVQVPAQAPGPNQAPAPVVIQNDTGLVQAAKQGLGTGAGLAVGSAIGNAVVGMFSSDE